MLAKYFINIFGKNHLLAKCYINMFYNTQSENMLIRNIDVIKQNCQGSIPFSPLSTSLMRRMCLMQLNKHTEIWSALLILFDLLKNAVCIPCPINNDFDWRVHCCSRPQQLFIDPLAIQWPPFDPVTIYQPLGWSN